MDYFRKIRDIGDSSSSVPDSMSGSGRKKGKKKQKAAKALRRATQAKNLQKGKELGRLLASSLSASRAASLNSAIDQAELAEGILRGQGLTLAGSGEVIELEGGKFKLGKALKRARKGAKRAGRAAKQAATPENIALALQAGEMASNLAGRPGLAQGFSSAGQVNQIVSGAGHRRSRKRRVHSMVM